MKHILLTFGLLFSALGMFLSAQVPLTGTVWNAYVDASPHGNFGNIPSGTGLTFSQWRRYNNSTYQSASDGYNSQNLNGNPAGHIASYIKTNASTSLNITQLSFVVRRSSTGPTYFRAYLRFPATGVVSLIGTGNLTSTNNQTISFQTNYCIPANDSVEIRLVPGGASGAAGTFRVVNGTSISGTSNAACTPQSVLISPPAAVCIGQNAVISLNGAPGTSIVYNVNDENILGQLTLDTVLTDGSGNAGITLNNVTGDSTVHIISAFTNPCCAVNIMQTVLISPQPIDTPFFTQLGPFCSGGPAVILPASSVNGYTGTWSPAFNNTATTTYIFTPVAGQCAAGTPSMTIQIDPAPVGIETAHICYGQSYMFNGINYTTSNHTATDTFPAAGGCDSIVTLNLTVSNPPQSRVVSLDACDQLSYNNQVYTQSTILYDTLYTAMGCDSIYRETRISIHNNPQLLQVDTIGCEELWLNGKKYTTSAIVRDTVKNIFGCDSVYRQFNVTINHFNMRYTLDPEQPYEREPFTIRIEDEFNGNFEVYSWLPYNLFRIDNGTEQYLTLMQDQVIRAYGRSAAGCPDSLVIPIKLRPYSTEAMMPNAFTPNGDGRNDVFIPKLKLDRAYSTMEFRVFNRYGQMVHSTSNLNIGWDGTSGRGGEMMEQGVYYYTISILFLDGTSKQFKGAVTLIR